MKRRLKAVQTRQDLRLRAMVVISTWSIAIGENAIKIAMCRTIILILSPLSLSVTDLY